MLPKHKQGAPAPEKVLTFLLFQCSVLKWWWWWRKKFSDGGLVVLLWSWCGALLTIGVVRYSQRHQNGSRFWDNGGKSDFYSCTPLFTRWHTLYTSTPYTPFNIKGMYTLSPPVDSNAPLPSPHTRAQMCSPYTLRQLPSFDYMFHFWCLLTYILSKFSLASFSCLRELSETVWEYCVLVLTVLPLSICLTHGFYLERHSSNCVTTNILQNFICITIYNRCAMKVGQYERPFKIGI